MNKIITSVSPFILSTSNSALLSPHYFTRGSFLSLNKLVSTSQLKIITLYPPHTPPHPPTLYTLSQTREPANQNENSCGCDINPSPLTTVFGVTIFAGQSYFNLSCFVLKYLGYRVYKQLYGRYKINSYNKSHNHSQISNFFATYT